MTTPKSLKSSNIPEVDHFAVWFAGKSTILEPIEERADRGRGQRGGFGSRGACQVAGLRTALETVPAAKVNGQERLCQGKMSGVLVNTSFRRP
jgi:hypothetical protein